AARQYPTCFKGRAPAGAAKLVAPILFRYAPRRDEEEKGRKVNPTDLHLANVAARKVSAAFASRCGSWKYFKAPQSANTVCLVRTHPSLPASCRVQFGP